MRTPLAHSAAGHWPIQDLSIYPRQYDDKLAIKWPFTPCLKLLKWNCDGMQETSKATTAKAGLADTFNMPCNGVLQGFRFYALHNDTSNRDTTLHTSFGTGNKGATGMCVEYGVIDRGCFDGALLVSCAALGASCRPTHQCN